MSNRSTMEKKEASEVANDEQFCFATLRLSEQLKTKNQKSRLRF